MKKLSSLSIFFPTFNDDQSILLLARKTVKILPKVARRFELIIVNDGSKASMKKVLGNLKKEIPFLKVVTHKVNRGYGAALKSGFNKAKYDFIFYTDGDGQYDVNQLTNLIAALQDDVDVVNGYKINRSDSLLRQVCGNLYSSFVKFVFGLKIRDVDCDFRLIRKSVIDKIRLTCDSGAICAELVKKMQDTGAVIVEVPVSHYPRMSGKSTFFNPISILNTLRDDFLLFFRKN